MAGLAGPAGCAVSKAHGCVLQKAPHREEGGEEARAGRVRGCYCWATVAQALLPLPPLDLPQGRRGCLKVGRGLPRWPEAAHPCLPTPSWPDALHGAGVWDQLLAQAIAAIAAAAAAAAASCYKCPPPAPPAGSVMATALSHPRLHLVKALREISARVGIPADGQEPHAPPSSAHKPPVTNRHACRTRVWPLQVAAVAGCAWPCPRLPTAAQAAHAWLPATAHDCKRSRPQRGALAVRDLELHVWCAPQHGRARAPADKVTIAADDAGIQSCWGVRPRHVHGWCHSRAVRGPPHLLRRQHSAARSACPSHICGLLVGEWSPTRRPGSLLGKHHQPGRAHTRGCMLAPHCRQAGW